MFSTFTIPGFPGKCPAELGGEGISSNYNMEQMCGTSQDKKDNYINNFKFASANTLKLCVPNVIVFSKHTKINTMAKRVLPMQMCFYRHALSVYKLLKHQSPENEVVNMNFL